MKLRIAHVDQVSFNSSEATNIEAVMKRIGLTLGEKDAALLFSLSFEQVVLVHRPQDVQLRPHGDGPGKGRVYVSTRFRLTGGPKWSENIESFYDFLDHSGVETTGLRSRCTEFLRGLGVIADRKLTAVG